MTLAGVAPADSRAVPTDRAHPPASEVYAPEPLPKVAVETPLPEPDAKARAKFLLAKAATERSDDKKDQGKDNERTDRLEAALESEAKLRELVGELRASTGGQELADLAVRVAALLSQLPANAVAIISRAVLGELADVLARHGISDVAALLALAASEGGTAKLAQILGTSAEAVQLLIGRVLGDVKQLAAALPGEAVVSVGPDLESTMGERAAGLQSRRSEVNGPPDVRKQQSGQLAPGSGSERAAAQVNTEERRSEILVGRDLKTVFDAPTADKLKSLGIENSASFVQRASTPSQRADLATSLGVPRSRVVAMALWSEVMSLPVYPKAPVSTEQRQAFRVAGIHMLETLSECRHFSRAETSLVIRAMSLQLQRQGAGPVSRGLLERLAKLVARLNSRVLFAQASLKRPLTAAEAQELLLKSHLHDALRRFLRDAGEDRPANVCHRWPALHHDAVRNDGWICYWIDETEPADDSVTSRRVYLCIDPRTGEVRNDLAPASRFGPPE